MPKTKMYQLKLNNVLFFVRTVWRSVSNKMLYRHNLDCLISSCDVRFMTKINDNKALVFIDAMKKHYENS